MALSDDLIKKLKGKFEPSATTQFPVIEAMILLCNQMKKEMRFVPLLEKQMEKV